MLGVLLITPGAALAAQDVGLPLTPPPSATQPPPGFISNALQAEAAAEATRQMQALHARKHPLYVQPLVWAGRRWLVGFSYRGLLVADVDETAGAKVTAVWIGPYATAVYTHGHYAPIFDSPWVVIPFSALFLVPFLGLGLGRGPGLLVADGLAILSFLISYWLFDHRHLEPGVWLAYPPMLYLLARLSWIGFRGGGGAWRGARAGIARLAACRLDTRVLWVGLLALVGARIGLSLANREVIDVGYASVIGAHRIAHGLPLYYASAAHGDTYGPIAYLAYVPFEQIWPWHGVWDHLPSAHAAAIAFDLLTIAGLVALGHRLRPGGAGTRLGLALGWAWAACPFTLLALMMHTNDELVALLSVAMLLLFFSPAARGAMLALAAAAKFTPAALLGVIASPRERGWRATLVCVSAFLAVVVVVFGLYLPPGGVSELYDHTIGWQLSRPDVFSPWALHPGLAAVKVVFEVLVALFAAAVAFVPRGRSLPRAAALCGAVTIAVELPAVHWFYYYVVWFLPFALVALLAAEASGDPPLTGDPCGQVEGIGALPERERELVPA